MNYDSSYRYGIRLAVIYALIWFVDLLDASSLNVVLPIISDAFHMDPTDVEWAIVGFLLSMTIAITVSHFLSDKYGTRKIFLLSQVLYIIGSIGCGFSGNLTTLVFFRLWQGFSAGLAIPLGMAVLIRSVSQIHWTLLSTNMNMVTLIAPAIGPLFGGYVTSLLGWRWIFFSKLPLSFS